MKANTKQQAIDNLIKVIMISVMKNLFILLLALLTFTTCDDSDRDDTWLQKKKGGRLVEIPVYIGLRPMVNAITTRAENPLDPATENYMNSLRFFRVRSRRVSQSQRRLSRNTVQPGAHFLS